MEGFSIAGAKNGNRDKMPSILFSLTSFAIDVHPVTNEQFVRFLEVMGGEKDNQHNNIIKIEGLQGSKQGEN